MRRTYLSQHASSHSPANRTAWSPSVNNQLRWNQWFSSMTHYKWEISKSTLRLSDHGPASIFASRTPTKREIKTDFFFFFFYNFSADDANLDETREHVRMISVIWNRDNRGRGVSVFSVYRSNSRKIKSTRIVYWLSRDTPGRIRQITSRRVEAWRIALLVEFKYGADNDYETRGSNTKMATASNRRTHAHGWSTRCSAVRRGRDALARIT